MKQTTSKDLRKAKAAFDRMTDKEHTAMKAKLMKLAKSGADKPLWHTIEGYALAQYTIPLVTTVDEWLEKVNAEPMGMLKRNVKDQWCTIEQYLIAGQCVLVQFFKSNGDLMCDIFVPASRNSANIDETLAAAEVALGIK